MAGVLKHKSHKPHIIGRVKSIKKNQYAVMNVSKHGKRFTIKQEGVGTTLPKAQKIFIREASDPKNTADRVVLVKGIKQVTG